MLTKQVKCPGCDLRFYTRTNYVNKIFEEKSSHQVEVEKFMKLGGQEVPEKPTIPDSKIRELRAKLILEEALETCNSLGFYIKLDENGITLTEDFTPNLTEIVDGCADLLVVTTGTLSACGVKDIRPVELVDENNLKKFKWSDEELGNISLPTYSFVCADKEHTVVKDSDGKILKPPSHKKPCLEEEIERQQNLK